MKAYILKNPIFIIFLGLFVAGLAFPQAGRGVARVGGVVVDTEGKPVAGAKVAIVFSKDESAKLETTTNKKGEWAFLGLGSGDWNMTVTAAGHAPLSKLLSVSQLSVNPKVTVTLKKSAASGGTVQDEATFLFLEQGNQLFKDAKYDEAIAAYEEFMAKNPDAYQARLAIADCYREKGEFDKAIEFYNKVIEQAGADQATGKDMTAKAQAGIGNCYLRQNKLPEAQDYFKQSVDNSPDDEVLAYNVGEIYFSNQKPDEALTYFDIASRIKPDWADPCLKMGFVYLNKGDKANAALKFEKFLSLEPDTERAGQVKNILDAIKK